MHIITDLYDPFRKPQNCRLISLHIQLERSLLNQRNVRQIAHSAVGHGAVRCVHPQSLHKATANPRGAAMCAALPLLSARLH